MLAFCGLVSAARIARPVERSPPIDSHTPFLSSIHQAFDQHLNMILGDVEETVTTTEVDEETDEEIVKKQTRKVGMLFVRGDIVVLVSPPLRAGG